MDTKRQFSIIGWALTVFYLVCIGLQILLSILLEKTGHLLPWYIWTEDFMTVVSQIIMYVFAFPVFCYMVRKLPSWFLAEKKRLAFGDFFSAFVICMGMAYIGNLIGTALMIMTDSFLGTQSINPVTTAVMEMNPWVMILTTVIVAPVMEEVMFRKMLIDRLVPYGQRTAVVFSGLTFGLFHGNFYQFFYAFTLGMIFAYLYSYTGKIRYNVILHMGINIFGGLVPMMLERWAAMGSLLAYIGTALTGLMALACIITSIVLSALFAGQLTWFPAWEKPEKGLLRAVISAPGIWAFAVVCVVEFAMMF